MATTTVKTITTSDLEQRIGEDVGTHVWNVLTDQWFNGELIPGSRRVPLDQLEESVRRSSLAKDTPIVVYCAGSHCPSSREAAEKLGELGYSNVEAFEGGLADWKTAGHDVIGGAADGSGSQPAR
jgi:rhodanese-related sulfurtransferase